MCYGGFHLELYGSRYMLAAAPWGLIYLIMTAPNLRALIRQQRRLLCSQIQLEHAHSVLLHFTNSTLALKTKRAAFYIATDGELDPLPLCEWLIAKGRTSYLPVLHPFLRKRLLFCEYKENKELIYNQFGILEPNLRMHEPASINSLDTIFLPLVAFDNNGTRLGMGGGYYDRTLSRLRFSCKRPRFIGLAHSMQCVPTLSRQSWDIPLDGVITESGLRYFPQNF